ncbi:MAG: hypothetical protein ACHQ1D_00025 [Nitrososphaerales archaeon]
MKPIYFTGHNTFYAKDQPLPVFKNDSEQGEVISCWKLSFKERIKIFFTGKLWISMMTFNKPLTQIYPTTNIEDVFVIKK